MWLYNGFDEYDSFYVCGDIHGEFKTLLYEIKRKKISNAIILIAGDCGIGFEKSEYYTQLYKKLSETLQKLNCQLLLIRGNHDDPIYFEQKLIDFPYMKTLPDYSIIRFKHRNILCVGGAISVDRTYRLEIMQRTRRKNSDKPKCYWENEVVVFNESALAELKTNDIHIDTVVTHTAPSFCMPITKSGIESWLLADVQLDKDVTEERMVIDKIYSQLQSDTHPVSDWIYGHFHNSHVEYISNVCFRMLDIIELCELRTNYNKILPQIYDKFVAN